MLEQDVLLSSTIERMGWAETEPLAFEFGPKGARLLALPRQWCPPFVLLSRRATSRLVNDLFSDEEQTILTAALSGISDAGEWIVRSSIIGETIWERGSFESPLLTARSGDFWSSLLSAGRQVVASAKGREAALAIQPFVKPDEQGEFGNLSRISKTRDHWEFSVRGNDPVVQNQRFNSQRDVAAATSSPLAARARLPRERLFGSVAAWINNELLRGNPTRVNCEWIRRGDKFYVVQIDQEDDDVSGLNPLQIAVEPSIPLGGTRANLRTSSADDRKRWDKLAVLDELYDEQDVLVPTLFVLEAHQAETADIGSLIDEFSELIQMDVVVRVSVRAGAEKIANLPKTDCSTPEEAAHWCKEMSAKLARDHAGVELAFIAHRFIGSKAAAWARVHPNHPVVEVHGTWGLPDALQLCPYDIWDVHVPREEIVSYPAYKSHVLMKDKDGSWRYQRVRNDVARFQSITAHQLLDIASRSQRVARRLGRPCHIMWFVGCTTQQGQEVNLPWYWTEAHDIEPPLKRSTHLMTIEVEDDLSIVPDLAAKYAGLGVVLAPRSEELLRDNRFLQRVADVLAPIGVPVILEGSALAHAFFQLQKGGCVVIPAGVRDHLRIRKAVTYGKLVRDKIPERIAAQKENQTVATIPQSSRLGYLIGKLAEEAIEARETAEHSHERLVELADVYEVLRALSQYSGYDLNTVAIAADEKRDKSGGFDTGQLLLSTSMPKPENGEGTSANPVDTETHLIEQISDETIRIPFTTLGFATLDSPITVPIGESGIQMQITLRRSGFEISVGQTAVQLSLEL